MTGDRLRSIPLFAGFDEADLDRIDRSSSELRLSAGDRLFEEGDEGRHAYVVVEGRLEVLKRSGEREILLAVREPGDVIGEMSLLEDSPRMATVRARTDARLLDVPKDVFDEILAASADAARALFGVLLSRWKETEARLRQREQLAQLGTLAAGLAHELNNPAAAVRRAAAGLPDAADRLAAARAELLLTGDPERAADLAGRLAGAEEQHLGSLARSDREDALVDRLRALGAERVASYAAALAGVDESTVDSVLDELAAPSTHLLEPVLAAAVAHRTVGALSSVVLDAAERISDIVAAVKSYTYMDRAPVQDVDLAASLDDTLLLLAHKLGNIEVVREYDRLPPLPAYGSELNQVWTNLLDNAADAVREAGRDPGRIVVRARVEDGRVVVEIEDDGAGIPDEVLPRVFDSFFTTKPPGSGTGLGLDISYGIVVHRHGGEIDIDTEPGRTTIRVTLPLTGPE